MERRYIRRLAHRAGVFERQATGQAWRAHQVRSVNGTKAVSSQNSVEARTFVSSSSLRVRILVRAKAWTLLLYMRSAGAIICRVRANCSLSQDCEPSRERATASALHGSTHRLPYSARVSASRSLVENALGSPRRLRRGARPRSSSPVAPIPSRRPRRTHVWPCAAACGESSPGRENRGIARTLADEGRPRSVRGGGCKRHASQVRAGGARSPGAK